MTDLPIAGYASLFWRRDLNNDVVAKGAFKTSLAKTGANRVRMLHQHDASGLIGAWDVVREDDQGLYVQGRVFDFTPQGKLVQSLIRAGVLDGLSIGFRTKKARRDQSGRLRVLTEVELWEVSLVTFPMLAGARLIQRQGQRAFPSPSHAPAERGPLPSSLRSTSICRSIG
jgi:HK97 family phage prohead protease